MTDESFAKAKALVAEKTDINHVLRDMRSQNFRIEMQVKDSAYPIPAIVTTLIQEACESRLESIKKEFYELK